jgi:glycosyltransferase involved in cell wall biosynthesis
MSLNPAGFDIITPVFEDAIPSLELLAQELFQQTYTNWNWLLCNNGDSRALQQFVQKLNDSRIHLLIHPHEPTPTKRELLENIWHRRDYCLKQTVSPYIIMLDADIKILEKNYLAVLDEHKENGRLLVYGIKVRNLFLPVLPIRYGTIDMGNYCFHTELAWQGYPHSVDWAAVEANKNLEHKDFHFFLQLLHENKNGFYFINTEAMLEWNGNKSYTSLTTLFPLEGDTTKLKRAAKILRKILKTLKA